MGKALCDFRLSREEKLNKWCLLGTHLQNPAAEAVGVWAFRSTCRDFRGMGWVSGYECGQGEVGDPSWSGASDVVRRAALGKVGGGDLQLLLLSGLWNTNKYGWFPGT